MASAYEHERLSRPIKDSTVSPSSAPPPRLARQKLRLEISFASIYTLLHHLSIVGFIIFIVYIFEYHPPFPNSERFDSDIDMFIFLILICMLCGFFSIQRNSESVESHKVIASEDDNQKPAQQQQPQQSFQNYNSAKSITHEEVVQMQQSISNGSETSTARRRFVPDDNTIQSDDLISLLENSISGGSHSNSHIGSHSSSHNGSTINEENEIHMKGNEKGSSPKSPNSISNPPVKADKILEEIFLNEEQTVATKGVTSAKTDVLAELPVVSPNPDNDILNIHQSLELKGFMTICFLCYQFTNAHSYNYMEEIVEKHGEIERENVTESSDGVNYYYNISRICVTAFLFLTGYGHAMFFYHQKDYSLARLIQVIFRINFSGMILCLALGKPYIFYTACWLHTYFFLLIYITMKFRSERNYTTHGLRLKMALLAFVIFLFWDCDSKLWSAHIILFGSSKQSVDGAPYGQLWEFYFRGHLHHWAAFLGMLFATNHPVTSLLIRKLEAIGSPSEILFKTITGVLLTITATIWVLGPFDSTKFIYNATNPYFGSLPVLFFIYFRNLTPMLRDHHVQVFKKVGVYSLEIYLLHHHLFIAEDGTMKKMLLPGYPTCNLLLSIWLLLTLARSLRISTSIVISMITSKSKMKEKLNSGRNALIILGTLAIFHSVAVILEFMQMMKPEVIATTTIICGVLLYQTVTDLTFADQPVIMSLRMSDTESVSSIQTSKTILSPTVSKTSPPILGTMTILLCCLALQMASLNGSNSTGLLPPICKDTVNDGLWVPINSCSEYEQGRKAKEFHSRLPSTKCDENYQWGWSQNKMSSQCKFHFLTPVEAQSKLRGKNVVFIGDTMTRNLYFAVCRALGDTNAGSYDEGLPVHSEITKKFGSITMTFKWAPLVTDIMTMLNSFTIKVDIVVTGSGAWDKLHLYATDEDQNAHVESLKRLASQLEALKEKSTSTIWLTPTTMNTDALATEELRTQMGETRVEEMRKLYKESGVNSAASFVIQGETFTKGQSDSSYDGIHYPPHVYDIGSQIMMNSIDWLLPNIQVGGRYIDESFEARTGSMANQPLGLMVLGLILVGLLFHDGFFGLFHIAAIFVQPNNLHNRTIPHYAKNRYSFIPSNVYSQFNQYVTKKHHYQSGKRNEDRSDSDRIRIANMFGEEDFSNTNTSAIPKQRSLGNLATIREDSNSNGVV